MWVEFYLWDFQQFGCYVVVCCDDVGYYQFWFQSLQLWYVEYGYLCCLLMDFGFGVEIVVGGCQFVQFDGVNVSGVGGFQLFYFGEQGGCVSGCVEMLVQCDCWK